MKNIIFKIHLILICNVCNSQVYFEGKIEYKNTFVSKLANVKVEKLISFIGTKQEYFIKAGKYLSITNGIMLPVQMYKNSINKIYTKKSVSCDTIFCIDAFVETSKIIEFNISEANEKVLGYKCNMLYLKTSTGTTFKYYYSNSFNINSESFKKNNKKKR